MSLVVLLGALLPWAASPASALFRIYLAVGILSIEMQLATWSGTGTLYTLPLLSLLIAAVIAAWQRRRGPANGAWIAGVLTVAPWPAMLVLAALVLALNLLMPLQAADPYHLERVAQIERLGTLEYDAAAEPKVNVMGWVYELALADVRRIPVAGPALVRVHGIFGLLLYLIGLAAARDWFGRTGVWRWPWAVFLTVPVAFHAFVLIKNDVLIGMAAFAALAWLVARAQAASSAEIVRASALIGFVVGLKLTNLPLAFILAGGVLVARHTDWPRSLVAVAVGTIAGAVGGGLFFTLQQNAKWYGDLFASGPVGEMGNMTGSAGAAIESVVRFGISLFDLGQLTTRWWPGRGGWGGTFGLPFIWALAVLLAHIRDERNAQWILSLSAAHFVAFAAVFPDADVAHRLALASGLLVIAGAADIASRNARYARAARAALVPVLVLSAVQISRSAVLYLSR
jgi:hypothetical protein